MTSRPNQVTLTRVQGWPECIHAEYMEGESLVKMVEEDLMTRRISIDGCRTIIRHLRDQDATTRSSLEVMLAQVGERDGDAEKHASRMAADMYRLIAHTKSA
jgi:bacterioferritin (cytochrome b1)